MNYDELKKHIFIVIGREHYTPLGVIRSLGMEGIYPIAIIEKNKKTKIASVSKYISRLIYIENYDNIIELLLSEYGNSDKKVFIIPCDDNITSVLDENYDKLKNNFYLSNAGKNGRITFYEDKNNLNSLAKKYGLNVARTWLVKRGEIPKDIEYPVITKPNESYPGWKEDYYICKSEEELRDAYTKIKGNSILLQYFIEKKNELCLDGVSVNKGKDVLISIASNYTYVLPDYYSMVMIIKNFDDKDLQTKLKKMFEEIGYEGIFSIEFLIDENDKLWFLEINFRNSTWSWASTKLGMNLPILWSNGMMTNKIPKTARKKIPKNYKAMAEIPDFEQRVRQRKMITYKEWKKEKASCDCLFYYDKDDKKPYYSVWKYKVYSILSKIIKKIIRK